MRIFTYIALLSLLSPVTASAADISFDGNSRKVITVTPAKNTGLDHIYVLYDTQGVSISYTASSADTRWYRYSNLGGGFAEEITDIKRDGTTYTLENVQGDLGYIIEDNSQRICFWITDYSKHSLQLDGVDFNPVQQCENTSITLIGHGDAIHYFTINGQQRTLSREIEIAYDTQQWQPENNRYADVQLTNFVEAITPETLISPPVYSTTYFTVSGDIFLRQWGLAQTVRSQLFHPNAVEVNAEAVQKENNDENSNRLTAGTSGLGGSAPAEISFLSYNTEAVIHSEWQMATDPDFENITYRINQPDLDYTFMEEGTVYVRYVGSNADGSCEQYSDIFTVSIGNSELKCPNAFSPGASEGINDEWKVSYRSIIDFECWIFDRYGNEMHHFTDPSQGWDGKYRGKLVNPGVYFYVIQATGADGKKYKKSGDINILRYKTFGNGGAMPE